jgi:hypothetical protein
MQVLGIPFSSTQRAASILHIPPLELLTGHLFDWLLLCLSILKKPLVVEAPFRL